MKESKYTEIKSEEQYYEYCDILEKLLFNDDYEIDEIELLTILIENWDNKNNTFNL